MSFLDEVINTTKDIAATAGEKTDKAVKFSKLKIKESQINGDIKTKYEALGSLIYAMAKANKKDDAAFDTLMSELDAAHAELSAISASLDELRNEVTCTECGSKTKSDNAFCPKCGAKLPEPVKEEVKDEPKEEAAEEPKDDTKGE